MMRLWEAIYAQTGGRACWVDDDLAGDLHDVGAPVGRWIVPG
jgi:hypothetical protein